MTNNIFIIDVSAFIFAKVEKNVAFKKFLLKRENKIYTGENTIHTVRNSFGNKGYFRNTRRSDQMRRDDSYILHPIFEKINTTYSGSEIVLKGGYGIKKYGSMLSEQNLDVFEIAFDLKMIKGLESTIITTDFDITNE